MLPFPQWQNSLYTCKKYSVLKILKVIVLFNRQNCRAFKKKGPQSLLSECFFLKLVSFSSHTFCFSEQLLEFMHQLPAFANMTMSVRRELCAVMVFAVVERAGTIVLNDGEEVRKYFYQLTMSLCEARSMQQRTKTLSSLKTMGNNKFALLGIMIHSKSFPNPLFYFLLFAAFRWYW